MDQFTGKVAVITGAASGIGRALALRCAREGMKIALADINPTKLAAIHSEISKLSAKVIAAQVDVSKDGQVKAFAEQCHSELGHTDLLFNNAGILRVGPTWSHSQEDWQKILGINVMGIINGVNAFVPSMIETGTPAHIVNTGSVGSLVAAPGMAQYTACKMAVRGITETLAYDLAAIQSPIDVSLLCPGPVLTSISDELLGIQDDQSAVDASDHLMAGEPGFITPDECAERVFTGIRARRFWIFTHPFNDYIQRKTQAIINDANPVYDEVTFDENSESAPRS